MFSSTRVEDCIQNSVCSSRRTSPHASSQYLQIQCQSGNLICLASQIPWKAGSDRFCIRCLNVPYAQCDWFQWVNLGELQLSMSDDEKPFRNRGRPLICAFLVAAVSVVTGRAATHNIQGTLLSDASLYFSNSTTGFLFDIQHQLLPLI